MSEQLSASEVGRLRQIIKNNSPMAAVNGTRAGEPRQESEGPTIQRLENAAVARGKMPVVNLNDDHAVEHRIRKAGFSKMKPGEVYGLGISRQQIMTLSASDLKALIVRFKAELGRTEYTMAAPAEPPAALRTVLA